MKIELLIADPSGTKLYYPAVKEGIEWTTNRKNTPGKLTFQVLKDEALDFSEGSAVQLRVDGDKIFFGLYSSSRGTGRKSLRLLLMTNYGI